MDRLKKFRKQQDWQGLLYALNEGIHGNMGGMGKSVLYRRPRPGTKVLVEQYSEIDDALRLLAELPEEIIPTASSIFSIVAMSVTAGLLSCSVAGECSVSPRRRRERVASARAVTGVISGSSAGSIAAAALAAYTDEEMAELDPIGLLESGEEEGRGVIRQFVSLLGSRLTAEDTEQLIATIPDLTFAEAYAKTGRQVSITVAPAEPHQRSRLLNAVSSPNVYLRSAAMSPCYSGCLPAVMLQAKNEKGEAQPHLPARRWVAGSVADDLPAKRLSRLSRPTSTASAW